MITKNTGKYNLSAYQQRGSESLTGWVSGASTHQPCELPVNHEASAKDNY